MFWPFISLSEKLAQTFAVARRPHPHSRNHLFAYRIIKMSTEPATPVMKKALVTGITGQDGSYLAELLISKVRWFGGYRITNTDFLAYFIANLGHECA